MPTETPKRGRGRPPADPAAGRLERVVTKLTRSERDHLRARYGTEYAGLRELVRRAMAAERPAAVPNHPRASR